MSNNAEPIITEVYYEAPLSIVWEAITQLHHMQKWYFEMLDAFNADVGFTTSFVVMVEDRKYTHQWKVTEVIPQQKIVYDWNIAEYDGASYSMFEVIDKGEKTQLTVTSVVTKAFPEGIPEFNRDSGVQGWKFLLEDKLTMYLSHIQQ